ncbi:DEAD/DEAH box helicase domain protein [Xylanimonas cellulosilytica DSM 15894]|uniref:DEAD/DEAH box helicase domain protein n=1 Tax=Xylanimonas cellulosilytica (strain DSM 15894 / JCM 12276 / CECT 5975 / KCTC 9989 / LMG 20990 / NBRC 107835 / XIL07) TaxID=446471 RepID=D1BVL7_XYLCX|nr:DEAD/DEAH box helicase [Xylanimonas cellulosilytica]ACZ31336.1 DEAD/DEAH box helicase domain protein [Xylanimonas cellulosilytica DSM 15894]
MNLDPIATSDDVVSNYTRYLGSLLPLRDTELLTAVRSALADRSTIARGPLLEATPPFQSGVSLGRLVEEGVLSPWLNGVFSDALPADRPLYRHQEESIRKATQGKNLVVATGTGSGKTESFLIPVLNHLACEAEGGTLGPGVRALLLYPMNALANDQLKRMRQLLAKVPQITFGRYTGETKQRTRDALDHYRAQHGGEDPVPNELISREQMQATPPHILLTNYAMLEYLLLRPADITLFEGTDDTWKFVVVDEAHVYDGVQGAEISMLLRRLRDRVARGQQLQFLASSATVGDDMSKVAAFGRSLFGAPFEWVDGRPESQDVVQATRHAVKASATWGPLTPEQIHAIAQSPDPTALIDELGGGAFDDEASVRRLHQALDAAPRPLRELAAEVFPGVAEDRALRALVDLVDAAHRVHGHHGSAALSARYHLFVSAVEGAYACLGTKGPHVTFSRHKECPTCEAPVFEIAACKRCGALHVPGTVEKDGGAERFRPLDGVISRVHWALVGEATVLDDEDDEAHLEDAGGSSRSNEATLCTDCAAFGPAGAATCYSCASSSVRQVLRTDAGRELNHCQSCGARSSRQVRRLTSGSDATAAVLASSLYEHLPADPSVYFPGQGRRLLMFSDSRQQAAFAAPYLQNSYGALVQRAMIVRAIRKMRGEELAGSDLMMTTLTESNKADIFDPYATALAKRIEIATWIQREMIEGDERTSVEGTGLATVRLMRPRTPPPMPLTRLGLTGDEAWALLDQLVQTLRIQGAVGPVEENVDFTVDALAPRNREVFVREEQSDAKQSILAWVPSSRSTGNRRSDYLTRVLDALGSTADCRDLLTGIWRFLTTGNAVPWLKLTNDKRRGPVYRVDPDMLRWSSASDDDNVWRCDRCRRFASVNVRGVCPTNGCRGQLQHVTAEPDPSDHYAQNYLALAGHPLRAEEHTAQLTGDVASQLQEQFVAGEVNVLSCSTTFELGVDVGELQSVMLRNVPPTTANYVQRAGRAGRRTDSAALVLTFAQMRSHDQAMFQQPLAMIQGTVRAPIVVDDNARVDRRHAHSIAIATFFRYALTRHDREFRNVADFFANGSVTGHELLKEFLSPPPTAVVEAIKRVLPSTVHEEIGIDDGGWVTVLLDLVQVAAEGYDAEASYVAEQQQKAVAEEKYQLAGMMQRVARSIDSQPLLGYLARTNVLPKYGFPVDTVELKVPADVDADAAALDLSRDLAIAVNEYAPGGAVVARGKVIESAGIRRLPQRDLPLRHYAVCRECNHLDVDLKPLDGSCSACGEPRRGARHEYIKPEYGFVSSRKIPRVGLSRPLSTWTSQTFLLDDGETSTGPVIVDTVFGPINARLSVRATMCILNEGPGGRGFVVCDWCGWATRGLTYKAPTKGGTRASHENPCNGKPCNGFTRHLSLAHDYQTDALILSTPQLAGEAQARSVLYALLAGASDALEISRDDIDGTLLPARGNALALFDTVPAGAGLVKRIAEDLPGVAAAAAVRVEACDCGVETSCYRCLRVYRNQKYHEELRRDLVLGAVR